MALFGKVKSPKDRKQLVELLAFIIAGTNGPAGGANVPVTLAKEIMKAEPEFITIETAPDPAGLVKVSANAAAMAASGAAPAASGGAVTEAKPSAFKLEKGIAIPESKRGGVKGDTYPFAQMEVNDSFFVAATEARKHPAKSLASTTSSANKRYAKEGGDGRTFTVRAVEGGARVWRTK